MTLIRPITLFTSETWPLRKMEETRLKVFERRILIGKSMELKSTSARVSGVRHNFELKGRIRPDMP